MADLAVESGTGRTSWSEAELRAVASEGRIPVAAVVPEDPDSTHATFESLSGDYRASIPLAVARRQGVMILDEFGSLRLRVEDGDTLCWNVKDLERIRLTDGPEPDSVPENPPH